MHLRICPYDGQEQELQTPAVTRQAPCILGLAVNMMTAKSIQLHHCHIKAVTDKINK
jgi:hypothetical protein